MASTRHKGLVFVLIAAAVLAVPAIASARHWHGGHRHGGHHYGHHHHRHHWHGGGRWYGGHHHWGHRHYWGHRHWGYRPYYGFRNYGYYGSWYPRSYINFGWGGVGWNPYWTSSYWGSYYAPTSFYFQYTPRSYYYRSAYPAYYYGCAVDVPNRVTVPDSVLPYVGSGTEVLLSKSRATAPLALAARTPRVPRAAAPEATRDAVPIVRLASKSTPVERAPLARLVARPPVEHVSLAHSARRVLHSGDSAFQGGRYSNAAGFYQIAVEQAPTNVQAHVRAGHALLAARRYHEAYRTFCQALSLDPAAVLTRVDLETLYVDPAEKEARMEALAKTTLNNPHNPALHALLGLYLVHDGQAERASKFFAEAQRLTAGSEPISAHVESPPRHVASATATAMR